MTRSPLQVLAEYCGHEWHGNTQEGCHVIGPGYAQWLHKDVLFCRVLDKLAAEGKVAIESANRHDNRWRTQLWRYVPDTEESHFTSHWVDTRIDALAKLVEKLKEGK